MMGKSGPGGVREEEAGGLKLQDQSWLLGGQPESQQITEPKSLKLTLYILSEGRVMEGQ